MSMWAQAGAYALKYGPQLLGAALNKFGGGKGREWLDRTVDTVTQYGNKALGYINQFTNKGGDNELSFRNMFNRVGAFVDQKMFGGNMSAPANGNKGEAYRGHQVGQYQKLTTKARDRIAMQRSRAGNRGGGGEQTNPEKPPDQGGGAMGTQGVQSMQVDNPAAGQQIASNTFMGNV